MDQSRAGLLRAELGAALSGEVVVHDSGCLVGDVGLECCVGAAAARMLTEYANDPETCSEQVRLLWNELGGKVLRRAAQCHHLCECDGLSPARMGALLDVASARLRSALECEEVAREEAAGLVERVRNVTNALGYEFANTILGGVIADARPRRARLWELQLLLGQAWKRWGMEVPAGEEGVRNTLVDMRGEVSWCDSAEYTLWKSVTSILPGIHVSASGPEWLSPTDFCDVTGIAEHLRGEIAAVAVAIRCHDESLAEAVATASEVVWGEKTHAVAGEHASVAGCG